MKYGEYEAAFSPARLNKYRIACGEDTRKAIWADKNYCAC